MTVLTTMKEGHDTAYFTSHQEAGGCTGSMSYYSQSGEPAGQWAGSAAVKLGLTGTVDAEVFNRLHMQKIGPDGERLMKLRPSKDAAEREAAAVAELLAGNPFASATEIAEVRAEAKARNVSLGVPYYDFVLSAAKSVSVLHASLKVSAMKAREDGDTDLAGQLDSEADGIEADLIESARLAVLRMQESACYTRTGHHSSTSGEWRDGAGLIGTTWVHHISRDGDPQLHVHVPVANLVQRADGADDKWRALDGRALNKQRLRVAAYNDREMEQRLIARGYAMVQREDGNGAEVGGVSQDVMNMFSSRTRHLDPELIKLIDQYVEKYKRQPNKRTIWVLGQQAAQNSRRSKAKAKRLAGGQDTKKDVTEAERFAAWETQTEQEEIRVLSTVHREAKAYAKLADGPKELNDEGRFRAARIAVAEVSKHHTVWSLAELAFEVNRALPVGSTTDDITAVCELATSGLSGAGVIDITAPDVVDARVLGTRKNGTSIYRPPNEGRFTTTGQLDLEDKITELAERKVTPRISEEQALEVLAGTDLTGDQRSAVVQLLTSGNAVTILTAPAGAGKTHSVAAFSKAWMTLLGKRVIGLATSQNAAEEMYKAGVSSAYNTAAFLGKTKGSDLLRYPVELSEGDVLILDESSMLSTSDLALILQAADKAGALVIPTGDMEQLGAVEAGGMVRALAEKLGAIELTEVLRFRDDWEKAASLRLRTGDKSVLASYDTRGRIRGLDREAAYERSVGAWLADHLRGKDVLLLAGSNAEAAELARMIQAQLIKAGLVQTPCAELHDGNKIGAGDLVRARLNAHIEADGRRLTNRDLLKIVSVEPSGEAVARRLLHDGSWSARFTVPASYIANSIELSYAGNVHVSQGRTVDISHVLATDSLSKESLYVALTRGREGNYAWAVTGEASGNGKPLEQATAESVLGRIMEKSSRELTATEQIREAQEWAGGTGHVMNLWSAATKNVTRASIEEHLRNYLAPGDFARYLKEPSRAVLNQALRERELSGQDINALIERITDGPMTGARSITGVLHARLEHVETNGETPSTWAERTPQNAPEIAREAARALDERRRELGLRQLAKPEPWLTAHLGTPPGSDASPLIIEDFTSRAGRAAAYRETAGITDPGQAISLEPHQGNPELETLRRDTIATLEIRDDDALIRAASRGELESRQLSGERAFAVAPKDVSQDLKLTALAEADNRVIAAGARIREAEQEARGAEQIAELLESKRNELEVLNKTYEEWSARTATTRESAGRAKTELDRRGIEQQEPQESVGSWWKDFEKNLEGVSKSIGSERQAAVESGSPWPPQRTAETTARDAEMEPRPSYDDAPAYDPTPDYEAAAE